MYRNKKILGIIPARGGSKGIPRKNILNLDGNPLISYTINQCHESKLLTDFFVSTEDNEIKEISKSFGSKVIDRPIKLSLDTSPTEECLIQAINKLNGDGYNFDYLVVLEPTSPFRTSTTIDKCIELIINEDKESLLTVIESKESIGELSSSKYFRPIRINQARRRQERKPFFIESSTLYVVKVDYLLENKSLVCKEWLAHIIDPNEALDINYFHDLNYANFLIKNS